MSLDDTLKDLLNESMEPVEPPPGLAEELVAKAAAGGAAAATGGASGGAFGLPLIIGIAVVAGAIIGGALGFFGGGEAQAGGTLSLDGVPAYACPGDSEVATLYRGDRVLITGRSGEWLAVRNVRGENERVFIHTQYVDPDASLSDLPEENCDDAGILTLASGEIVTTTTSTPPAETTTTMPPETTTTAVGETTTTLPATTTTTVATTTTQPPTTTTTTVATTTTQPPTTTTSTSTTTITTTLPPPTVVAASASPNPISEKFPGIPNTCPGTGITTVSAAVTAPSGVQSVTMSWSVSNQSGSSPMTPSGGLYRATLGPFDATDPGSVVPFDGSLVIAITVRVTDTLGRSDSNKTSVTLNDCTFG